MVARRSLGLLWPRSIGNQCLLMLPLGRLFLQASQIVVMPFLICELVVGFGSLRPGMLRNFLRSGLVPLPAGQLWRTIRGPLALTASLDPGGRQHQAVDELAPLVSLGYALPTLGQVAALWFIPFAGW